MFEESILCMSRKGPIAVRSSPLRIHVPPGQCRRVGVFSALVDPNSFKKEEETLYEIVF